MSNNVYKLFYDSEKKHKDKTLLKKSILSLVDELIEKTNYFNEEFICNSILFFNANAFNVYLKSVSNVNINLRNEEKETLSKITLEDKNNFDFLIDNLKLNFQETKNSIFNYPFGGSIFTLLFISNQKDKNGCNYYLKYDGREGNFYFHVENQYSYINYNISSIPTVYPIKTLNSWNKELVYAQYKHWISENKKLIEFNNNLFKNNKYTYKNNDASHFLNTVKSTTKINDSNFSTFLSEVYISNLIDLEQLKRDSGFRLPFKIELDKKSPNQLYTSKI